ncbi:MAG TPA: DUF4382 domain-containing protein [Candidatus Binatia bacterium]
MRAILAVFVCLVAMAFTTAANAAERDQGILEIQIKDHRDAIDDFAKLQLVVDKIRISPKPGLKFWRSGWHELVSKPDSIDLTQYVSKKTVTIFRGAIDTGAFDAFHLKIKSLDGVLKKTRRTTAIKNTVGPIKLAFDVKPQSETLLIIDLTVLDLSDHIPGGYELALRGYELYSDRKLIAKIPPA